MTRTNLAGETLTLDASGSLFWPREKLLAVADLHLEKGSACARQGNLLPPWDSAVTLGRLAAVIARLAPRVVVSVGDGFHDSAGAARLDERDARALRTIGAKARLIWVCGNHDPCGPLGLPGESCDAFALGPLTFRHEARAGAAGEISGHYHPKARVKTRAGDVTRPCFMADTQRIILPAFGAYTGGLDVTSPAITRLFPEGGAAFLLGREKLFRFAMSPPPRRKPGCSVAAPGAAMA